MKRYNSIVFSLRDYKTEDELYKAVAEQLKILLRVGCICKVYDADEKGGLVIIEYNNAEYDREAALPAWLTPDEEDVLRTLQDEKDLKYHKQEAERLQKQKEALDNQINDYFLDQAIKNAGKKGGNGKDGEGMN